MAKANTNTAAPSPANTKEEENKAAPSGVVTMTKEQYDTLMESMKKLQDKVDYVADKSRLERFNAAQTTNKNMLPIAGVSFIDGKPIVGWRTVMNEAEFKGSLYIEKQVTELTFEDNSVVKMDLLEFYRQRRKESGEVVAKSNLAGVEDEIWTIRLADGREVTLAKTFVN